MGIYKIIIKIITIMAMTTWPLLSNANTFLGTQASKQLLTAHYKDGWILDNFQGMAHSESMGMGLLAAVNTQNVSVFQKIWQNTQKLQRSDGLFSWQYDISKQAITDYNNATDGEIYIAFALLQASKAFNEPKYLNDALKIIQALPSLTVSTPNGIHLLPGQLGFNNGYPVINLSYYIYPAFSAFGKATGDPIWDTLIKNGMTLTEKAAFGKYGLPPDWLIVKDKLTPWDQRPPVFGYDAIRIPLYIKKMNPNHPVIARYTAYSLLRKPSVDLITDSFPDYSAPPGMQAVSAYIRNGYQFKMSKDYYDIALQVMIESFG